MSRIHLGLVFALVLSASVSAPAADTVPVYQARVINTFPHDSNAFTQGLAISQGKLYEGTGRNGQSSLRRVDLESGQILQRHNLSSRFFGEGITILGNHVYQLTWQSHTVFVYDLESFNVLSSFYLPGEGWGITHDGERLIVSDGSSTLRFLDPETNQAIGSVTVTDAGNPVERLNELEYVNGEIWANVWYEDYIVRIEPETGRVTGRVDLSGLNGRRNTEDVLNGIAWDPRDQRLFVTGKLWANLFEIEVIE